MNSKKKNKQEKKREEEVFDALCEIMEVTLSTFDKYKVTPLESFKILNSIYSQVGDTVIENRKEGITVHDVKLFLLKQISMLMNCIIEELPIKTDENEQTK